VRAAYLHQGLARRLIHDLKYRGIVARAVALAPAMAANLPPGTSALVPVPRSAVRRLQLGVDPGLELAKAVARLTGLAVVPALARPIWRARHAGKRRDHRSPVHFRVRTAAPAGVVIVDDVVTTGATVVAAASALGGAALGSITATSAGV
jgi:predicted amidophosphoribosyltransferase